MKKYLLVAPDFPVPPKSKNHKDFLPNALLKIGSYLKYQGNKVLLVRGIPKTNDLAKQILQFDPDEIWISTVFVYWFDYVKITVQAYKKLLPGAKIVVGGILASLLDPEFVKNSLGCDEVYQGTISEVEEFIRYNHIDYGLLNENADINFQIIHTSRGCPRKCDFCGVWRIEPKFTVKDSIINEVFKKNIVFYDNNILLNPYIDNILEELIFLKKKGKIGWVESQSGFDGRVLLEKPYLTKKIKEAGFRYPRIAWDGRYSDWKSIYEQVKILKYAGYKSKEIFIFMLYNWKIPFEEMEDKRIKCWEWKIQIIDSRFRPLNQLFDKYDAKKSQTKNDYYIAEEYGWTDFLVKQFRKNVRRQNICIRLNLAFYSDLVEKKNAPKDQLKLLNDFSSAEESMKLLKYKGFSCWNPGQKFNNVNCSKNQPTMKPLF